MWSRALHKFSDTWPHLIPLLLTALFREIRVVATAVGAPAVGGQAVDPHTSAAFSVRAIEPGRRQRHTLTWLGSWANVLIKEFPLGPCFSPSVSCTHPFHARIRFGCGIPVWRFGV
jgi:hypothetical protein